MEGEKLKAMKACAVRVGSEGSTQAQRWEALSIRKCACEEGSGGKVIQVLLAAGREMNVRAMHVAPCG